MTFTELVGVIFRRWYVLVAALAVGAAFFVLFAGDGGVYSTRTVVTFTLPQTTSLTPGNGVADHSVIAFAGLVAGEVNNGRAAARYSTDDAPYYGAGVREGVLVAIPNAGNQWYNDYSRAEIEVEVVGRSSEWVKDQQSRLISAILRIAQDRQAMFVGADDDRIEVEVVPLTLAIEHVAASRTQQILAAAALMVAASLVGAWFAVRLDRRILRRGRARRRRTGLVVIEGSVAT